MTTFNKALRVLPCGCRPNAQYCFQGTVLWGRVVNEAGRLLAEHGTLTEATPGYAEYRARLDSFQAHIGLKSGDASDESKGVGEAIG